MHEEDELLMQLLSQRVPLTLLIDLLDPPNAEELYAREGGDVDWVRAVPA